MATDAASRLELLYDLGCAFAARTDLDELVKLVVEKCCDLFRAEGASVLRRDPETDELYFPYVVASDPTVAEKLAGMRFPADQGIAGAVVQTGRSILVEDAAGDPRINREADRLTGTTTRSLLAAPLTTHQGTVGVLQLVNRSGGGTFSPDDLGFLESLAGSIAVAIENAELVRQLKASEGRLRTQVGVLRRDLARQDRFAGIVGTSNAMAEVFRLMESAAPTPITVLIQGESGTGKELVARGIHAASERADGPFIAVNCAALAENLLESELFGHRRGSFTGATHDRVGLFEAAKAGTIFLDEVGEMPAVMQAKLLRVLQEGEVVPVGDNRSRRVDVRVVSATNRDLTDEVRQGRFREDLYYRVATFPIALPALRERREDILPIAARMLTNTAGRYKKRIDGFEQSAIDLLVRYDWPGNVRELSNEIERATALARDGDAIGAGHLSSKVHGEGKGLRPAPGDEPDDDGDDDILEEGPSARKPSAADAASLRKARAAFEADFITKTLAASGGNITRAAQTMGLSRVALQKKMKEYGLR
jgi:transcriptional regulator with GAF, ATPase, and Fis domain